MTETPKKKTERQFPRLSRQGHIEFRKIENPREQLTACGVSEQQFQNICGGGIRFHAAEAITPDTYLAVRIELPHLPDTILALGRVVNCDAADETAARWELAVEFFWTGWGDGGVDSAIHEFLTSRVGAEKPQRITA